MLLYASPVGQSLASENLSAQRAHANIKLPVFDTLDLETYLDSSDCLHSSLVEASATSAELRSFVNTNERTQVLSRHRVHAADHQGMMLFIALGHALTIGA